MAATTYPRAQMSGGTAPERQGTSAGLRGDTREFVNSAMLAGLAEIQYANLAVERASNPDVKAFAQLMVKDHGVANSELAAVATQVNAVPPTDLDKKHRDIVERLTNVLPAEFDREYAKATIDGHQEIVDLLRARTGTGGRTDPAAAGTAVGTSGRENTAVDSDPLTQWAARTLPVEQQHVVRAQQLQQNIK